MHHFEPSYNQFLVALSFLVSVFGSYTGILLVKAAQSSTTNRSAWIIAAATALGGGAIWTMHFIGMLAYDMGMPVNYDPLITFASLAIAVIVVGIGLFFVGGNQKSVARLLVAGVITGLGVASMHYSGMYAMNMAASMNYDPVLFAVSIVIALVAATAALWLAFNLEGNIKMLLAAVVMGIAVCGMHYVGMAAMNMGAMDHSAQIEEGIKPLTLGLFIFCFSMLLLVLCLIVGMAQLSRKMYEAMEAEDDADEQAFPGQFAKLDLSASKHG
jgi:MHYT domain (predicted integral membrane sensor domain)